MVRGVSDTPIIHDPFSMAGMCDAVEVLGVVLCDQGRILVFGDYDADGVTSTAILMEVLDKLGAKNSTYALPNRESGYGLQNRNVEMAVAGGVDLLITVDNGVSALEPIALARSHGMKVIVIDHHETKDELPCANAVIDPKQEGCLYPFKGLTGAGLAFKFAQAFGWSNIDRPKFLASLLDLVALGSIADVAPMVSENHTMCKRGLRVIEHTARPGLQALKEIANIHRVTSSAVGFQLAPRLNSPGRLESPEAAYELLTTTDRERAIYLCQHLETLNRHRKECVENAIVDVESGSSFSGSDKAIIVRGNWPPGIVGLIAGRLSESYNVPALALTNRNGELVGSARSVPGFDITDALSSLQGLLKGYGGHAEAAGLSMDKDKFPEFVDGMQKAASDRTAADSDMALDVDAVLEPDQVCLRTLGEIRELLEPFGPQNPDPVFALLGCRIVGCQTMGASKNHLKLRLQKKNRVFEGLWWREAGRFQDHPVGNRVDVAFAMESNLWNGQEKVVLHIKDTRKG